MVAVEEMLAARGAISGEGVDVGDKELNIGPVHWVAAPVSRVSWVLRL